MTLSSFLLLFCLCLVPRNYYYLHISYLILSSSIFLTAFSSSSSRESYWTAGTSMPTARSEIAGSVLNEKIYIIGGFDNYGHSTSIVEAYDPLTEEWIQSTSM